MPSALAGQVKLVDRWFPVPTYIGTGTGNRGLGRRRGKAPTVGFSEDVAGGFEGAEGVCDGLFAGAHGCTELFKAVGAVLKGGQDALIEGGVCVGFGAGVSDVES